MSTGTMTHNSNTGPHTSPQASSHTTSRTTTQPANTNTPATQQERSAANRLRTTMAAVRLAFTWLGVRRTLAPEQRSTAARAIHADREFLSASKLILDTKNSAYWAVAAVRSKASGYWRSVTLPFPEAGVRLLPQNSLRLFASTMAGYRERLQEAARELASQYDQMKSEAQRRLGTLYNPADYPGTLNGMFDLGERPPQPPLTARLASRVDPVQPGLKEASRGVASRRAEVHRVAIPPRCERRLKSAARGGRKVQRWVGFGIYSG